MTARTMMADAGAAPLGASIRVCGRVRVRSGDTATLADSSGTIEIETCLELDSARAGDAVEVHATRTVDGFAAEAATVWPARNTPPEEIPSFSPLSYLRFRDARAVELLRASGRAVTVAREYLADHHFVEANTPQLWSATREYGEAELRVTGADDPEMGSWLLQSPTIPAMLCAIGGVDRAFQFSRCFRTEPGESPHKAHEFTQLNLAVTFTSVEEQFGLLEGLFQAVAAELGAPWDGAPFPVIDYDTALRRFGSDTMDFRYPAFPTPVLDGEPFGRPGRRLRLLLVPDCPGPLAEAIRQVAARHLGDAMVFHHVGEDAPWRPAVADLATPGPLAVVGCEEGERAAAFVALATTTLYPMVTGSPAKPFGPVWIRYQPFMLDDTNPSRSHDSRCLFGRRLGKAGSLADSYDLVVNGVELLSGSQNEVDPARLLENLTAAGVDDPEDTYGYYLRALQFGAPPLHNTSIGWERLMSVLLGVPMRDVMIMPKTGSGDCAVTGVPHKERQTAR